MRKTLFQRVGDAIYDVPYAVWAALGIATAFDADPHSLMGAINIGFAAYWALMALRPTVTINNHFAQPTRVEIVAEKTESV